MSTGVPVGAVVTRVYFVVPTASGSGPEHDTWEQACQEARRQKDQGWQQNLTSNRVWVDERWILDHPAHSAGPRRRTSLVVERTQFAPMETRDQWVRKGQSR